MKETTMSAANAINYLEHGGDVIGALENVEGVLAGRGIDTGLHHLLKLRASQINGCGFCVKMHTREAREDGETDQRLDHLVVWRRTGDYTPREKAALAWTEALTGLDPRTDLGALRTDMRAHFTDHEITTLTAVVCMINLWNRMQISNH
jgi:AhpD family alkylhydroperoxidase